MPQILGDSRGLPLPAPIFCTPPICTDNPSLLLVPVKPPLGVLLPAVKELPLLPGLKGLPHAGPKPELPPKPPDPKPNNAASPAAAVPKLPAVRDGIRAGRTKPPTDC